MNNLYLTPISQTFSHEKIEDIPGRVAAAMQQSAVEFLPGTRIAIAVGSRGISHLPLIVRAVVDYLKSRDVQCFIVPAMGSHGGASAEGQREVLTSLGVTEASIGVPIRSSMQVIELPRGLLEFPVYQDQIAHKADGIIVINRIKAHTDFMGEIESGLAKMCVIGLGKHKQALTMHRFGVKGLRDYIPVAAEQILQTSKILLGIGLVENAYDETMRIEAIRPEAILREEKELLKLSRSCMPSLPVDTLDLLILDQMGKDISGTGMDPNIIGRRMIAGEPDLPRPVISRLIVCGLSEQSHGNALGMGMADFITRRLHDAIDFHATNENTLTSTFIERGRVPIIAETDRLAVEYAMRTWGSIQPEDARIIRAENTLHIDRLYVSNAVLDKIRDRSDITVTGDPVAQFTEDGWLTPFRGNR